MNSKPEGLSNCTILPLTLRQYRVKVGRGPELEVNEQAVVSGASVAACCWLARWPNARMENVNTAKNRVNRFSIMVVSRDLVALGYWLEIRLREGTQVSSYVRDFAGRRLPTQSRHTSTSLVCEQTQNPGGIRRLLAEPTDRGSTELWKILIQVRSHVKTAGGVFGRSPGSGFYLERKSRNRI